MKAKNILQALSCIALCQAAGIIGSLFTSPNIDSWYAILNRPWFTPPNWVFAPVWITLYTLMGISLYLVLKKKPKNKLPIYVFGIQLALNALWSYLFFGLNNPFYAFIEIIFLYAFILASIILFYKVDKRASYLLIPYIIWVSVATLLNYYIWILNLWEFGPCILHYWIAKDL